MTKQKKTSLKERRARRTRMRIKEGGKGLPRLSVFRSNKNIHAQLIDDTSGTTLASVSSVEIKKGSKMDKAKEVGKLIAERARAAGVAKIVFDRGPYQYHGRVKALADSAREGGLKF